MTEQAPILIIVIPLMFSFCTPLLGMAKRELCYFWVIAGLTASASYSLITLIAVLKNGVIHYHLGGWSPPWGIEYVVDHLNVLVLLLISGTALLVAIYSKRSVEEELPGKTVSFYTIFLLQVVGFQGIVLTGDLFNLYVFLEVASLTGYALIAIGEKGALLASFRYIIMGTVGACFYLLGVGYLYMVTGSLNMADLAQLLPSLYGSKVVLVAFAFFMAGLAVKMALFPLHVWLPDAYTRAPSTASALVAPLMTKVAVYVMVRILFTVFTPAFCFERLPAAEILVWLGIAAIFAGALMALAQTDFKRMLCYLVVAEVGYMVGGIGLANSVAFKGALLHLANDVIMTLGLFAIAGILTYQLKSHTIADFRACFRTLPFTMAALVVFALAIIGVPPTGGFFSKWYLLQGAVIAKNWLFVIALLTSSLINVILFFRIFEIGYGFTEHHEINVHGKAKATLKEAPLTMLIPTIIIAIGILLIGIYNQPVVTRLIQFAVPEW